ncbi:DUF932 domain-containing protein [Embleya sp. NBC_00896]|uniref:DUF932 domain-containing protein n=1 Tax=Embleya sp. NBC_00896 TaxID=2975961 RepID=UPI002F90BCB2|nr:DUF932 domain-containing protein [Embleya sp. NBC_00896]
MSKETLDSLNRNTLIGFTDKRGNAWHYRASRQGDTPNHYPGAIPVDDVCRRLFHWEAVPSRVYVDNPVTGQREAVPHKKAMLRSDTGHTLGIFCDSWQPHPYTEWLINRVGRLLDTSDLAIGSAGLLRNGAVAWVSLELAETIGTKEGVDFRPNLMAATAFNGDLSSTYKRHVTAIVCDNTMSTALNEAGQTVKFPHRGDPDAFPVIDRLRTALDIVYATADDFSQEVARLCAVHVSEYQWNEFLKAHAPIPAEKGRARTNAERKQDTLRELWSRDPRVSPWRGTAFGVAQATNTYEHHHKTVRGASRPERNMLRAVGEGLHSLHTDTLTVLGNVMDRSLLPA